MSEICNPIIPGMAPDPSILRVGEDYYIATSTFHWLPGVPVYHSKDLQNWHLLTYVLGEHTGLDLRGTSTPAGIWAPHLSYDQAEQKFWLVYCHMLNMAGREFNAETYAMCADKITGPWSKPLYLTSIGFDPALYHEGGRHYLSILEWETRSGHQAPGTIVLTEVDLKDGTTKAWHSLTHGFTTRGCVEAPQLYKHEGYYYLLVASGGTGYAHGVEMGRAKDIFGPYEPNPTCEPILTSSPRHLFSLGDPDAGHFEMYNPHSLMQKAGHGSLVETPQHEFYIAHLMSRPLPHTTLNPLGRETSLQQVRWTKEGWLELADGSNLAKMTVPAPQQSAGQESQDKADFDIFDDFSSGTYNPAFMTPYHFPEPSWVRVQNGVLSIAGRGSFFSRNNPSILATRATSFAYNLQTKVDFKPEHFSQTAGVGLYYDAGNWVYACVGLNDKGTGRVIAVLQAKLGQRIAFDFDKIELPAGAVPELRWHYQHGQAQAFCRWGDQTQWRSLTEPLDVSYLSDEGVNGEPGEIGGFTGLFNFIGSVDAYQHVSHADFFYYQVKTDN